MLRVLLMSFYSDGDIETWELRAVAGERDAMRRESRQLEAAGDLEAAARACPHGGGYGLRGLAAERAGDPRAGEAGERCHDCNSVVDDLMNGDRAAILHACEARWK